MKGIKYQRSGCQLPKYENPEPDPKKPLLVEGDKGLPTGASADLCLLQMQLCIAILFLDPLLNMGRICKCDVHLFLYNTQLTDSSQAVLVPLPASVSCSATT